MCVSSVLCSDISVKVIWAGDSVNAIRSGSWALLLQMILSVVQSPCLVKSSFLLLWSLLLWNPPRSANKKTVCKICWGWALPFFFFFLIFFSSVFKWMYGCWLCWCQADAGSFRIVINLLGNNHGGLLWSWKRRRKRRGRKEMFCFCALSYWNCTLQGKPML